MEKFIAPWIRTSALPELGVPYFNNNRPHDRRKKLAETQKQRLTIVQSVLLRSKHSSMEAD